jgi:hypothetical protein
MSTTHVAANAPLALLERVAKAAAAVLQLPLTVLLMQSHRRA